MLVDKTCPTHTLFARQFVAEHVEPAAGDLTVDLLLVHPLQPTADIAQRLGDGTRRLAASEGEPEAAARIVDELQRRLRGRIGADRLAQARRADMGMAVDDHGNLTLVLNGLQRWHR